MRIYPRPILMAASVAASLALISCDAIDRERRVPVPNAQKTLDPQGQPRPNEQPGSPPDQYTGSRQGEPITDDALKPEGEPDLSDTGGAESFGAAAGATYDNQE